MITRLPRWAFAAARRLAFGAGIINVSGTACAVSPPTRADGTGVSGRSAVSWPAASQARSCARCANFALLMPAVSTASLALAHDAVLLRRRR